MAGETQVRGPAAPASHRAPAPSGEKEPQREGGGAKSRRRPEKGAAARGGFSEAPGANGAIGRRLRAMYSARLRQSDAESSARGRHCHNAMPNTRTHPPRELPSGEPPAKASGRPKRPDKEAGLGTRNRVSGSMSMAMAMSWDCPQVDRAVGGAKAVPTSPVGPAAHAEARRLNILHPPTLHGSPDRSHNHPRSRASAGYLPHWRCPTGKNDLAAALLHPQRGAPRADPQTHTSEACSWRTPGPPWPPSWTP